MKLEELRIGNYIRAKSDKVIETVCMLRVGKINGCNLPFYEPVPLTEDWLIKFGFQEIRNTFSIDCLEYQMEVSINSFSGTLERYPNWFIGIKLGYSNDKVTITKQYIHQLQNLYYDWTDKELQIQTIEA